MSVHPISGQTTRGVSPIRRSRSLYIPPGSPPVTVDTRPVTESAHGEQSDPVAGIETELAGLSDHAGEHLGDTDRQVMSRERVDTLADATDHHRSIHVDPERAKDWVDDGLAGVSRRPAR